MKKEIEVFDFMQPKRDKRDILHENDKKFAEMDNRYNKSQRIKKIVIYSSAVIVLASSVVLVKKHISKINQPVQIITNDILANEGLLLTDDGRQVDPKKFSENDKESMYDYAEENNVKSAEINEKLAERLDKEGINSDLVLDQIKDDYPGIFKDNSVRIEERNKAK